MPGPMENSYISATEEQKLLTQDQRTDSTPKSKNSTSYNQEVVRTSLSISQSLFLADFVRQILYRHFKRNVFECK